jgi:hypothetical protein
MSIRITCFDGDAGEWRQQATANFASSFRELAVLGDNGGRGDAGVHQPVRVISAISGGQLIRTGRSTVPIP